MSRKIWMLAAAVAGPAAAYSDVQVALATERVASGLVRPVYVTHAPGDFSRIFIVEQRGSAGSESRADIKILNLETGQVLPTPFLTIDPVAVDFEQGLLGLAFHPNYASNGYFYVHYSDAANNTVVERYQVSVADPNVADAGSGYTLLRMPHPFLNHYAGWMDFDAEGYLYITVGDGGFGGDPGNRAQSITGELYGNILRVDVDRDDFPADADRNYGIPPDNPFVGVEGEDEIWSYGLRNPWRCSFDRETGDLYIADVGQNVWEEINFQPASSGGGENYGWRCYEGDAPHDTSECAPPSSMVFPFHVYEHTGGRCSVTGGYVYRGCAIPELRGEYFFADFCSGQIFTTRYTGASDRPIVDRTADLAPSSGSIFLVSSFGEDAFGEIYVCVAAPVGGAVYKIVPESPGGPDCNGNGQTDECDIAAGIETDQNNNGIPDSCECAADLDGSGDLTLADFTAFRNLYVAGDLQADFDGSGNLSLNDFLAFRNAYTAGCP